MRTRSPLAPFLVLLAAGLPLRADWTRTATQPGDTYVRCMAVIGKKLYVGTASKGIFVTSDNGATWTAANNGIQPTDTSVRCFAVSGTTILLGTIGGPYRSPDGGSSWNLDTAGMTSKSVYALALGGANVYAGTYKCNVYTSLVNGTSWTAGATKLADTGITALAMHESYLFAGTEGRGMFRSADGGKTWASISTGLTDSLSQTIRCLVTSGTSLFAGTRAGVFRSVDNGGSWSAVTKGMLHESTYSLLVRDTVIFAGAYDGKIYRSRDQGANWTAINRGITDTAATVRALAVCDTFLFAGTGSAGTGIWSRPLSELQKAPVKRPRQMHTARLGFEPIRGSLHEQIQFRVSAPFTGEAVLRIFGARGEVVATLVKQKIDAGVHWYRWNRGPVPRQMYFGKFTFGDLTVTRRFTP